MAVDGVTVPAFSASTLPPPPDKSNLKDKVIEISREVYATKRSDVEDYITEWSMPINLAEEEGARRKDRSDKIKTLPQNNTRQNQPERKNEEGSEKREIINPSAILKSNKVEILKDRFNRQWYALSPKKREADKAEKPTESPEAAIAEKVKEELHMDQPQSGGDRGEPKDQTNLITWEQADELGLKLESKDIKRPTNLDEFEPIDEL